MRHTQIELFGGSGRRHSDGETVAIVRRRLTDTLAQVQAAATMPWDGPLRIIREENAFRYGKDALPFEEGARLWAAFDAEMDRLYATIEVAPADADDTFTAG